MPLLSNSTNHDRWPAVIAKDVQKHVHSLKSTVYQVKGQVNGQTVLPMPVGVEKVHEVEKTVIDSDGEVCDLYLKSAIEGVIIKWAAQINDVLSNDSSENSNVINPVPALGDYNKNQAFISIKSFNLTANRIAILEFEIEKSAIHLRTIERI